MKIYNRKNFVSGLLLTILGIILFVLGLKTGMDWETVILSASCMFIGIGLLIRSASAKLSREDKLDELDERNKLVLLKNRSSAFRIVECACLVLMTVLFVTGKIKEAEMLIYVGIGLGIAFSMCLFTDLFTFLYYDSRN